MSSGFSGFNINVTEHSMEELLEEIKRLGYRTARSKRLDYRETDREVGYQILDTDITIGDPKQFMGFPGKPTLIMVFLPFPSTGLLKYDKDMNRKLYNKLKRKFEASFNR
ncbi:MAG: hypothetical protein JNM27_09680 [Leptospirales bacterium]|nr:hypothetical protein [Leptospirales bacterium]